MTVVRICIDAAPLMEAAREVMGLANSRSFESLPEFAREQIHRLCDGLATEFAVGRDGPTTRTGDCVFVAHPGRDVELIAPEHARAVADALVAAAAAISTQD